jgi:pimeloyl-ACP methyl ester carboxylesterase
MSSLKKVFLSFILVFFFFICYAGQITKIKPIEGGEKIGVLLMHGKAGDDRWIYPLAVGLRDAGVLVEAPSSMPWSKTRIYDKSFEESMIEIDGLVEKLKAAGARKIFVGGHCFGATVAMGYAVHCEGLNGLILLAPGHLTSAKRFRSFVQESVAKAEEMIRSGRGEEKAHFKDLNMGEPFTRYVSAKLYYSWFAPDGPASFAKNAKRMKPGTPLLYIVASKQKKIAVSKKRTFAFDKAPHHPTSKFVTIASDHYHTPADSLGVVVDWLRRLQ